MQYKLLGRSGLRVSELALGTMTFGDDWGWGASWEDSKEMFEAYTSAGGNFIDTANRYTNGTSEKYLGEFIASDRERIVLATKYTLYSRKDDPNGSGNQRKNMAQALDASLKRLNTGYIDLYWVHAWDFLTPVEEVVRALDDMVRVGKVLYVGISDTPAWVVSQANTLADLRGWTSFVGLQIQYNLLQRTPERDLLPMARAFNMSVTPWGILNAGLLTGKYNQPDPDEPKRLGERELSTKEIEVIETVGTIAGEIGCSPSQVAINWVRSQGDSMIPILGARSTSHLLDNLACLNFDLSKDQLRRLNEVSAIELGFPHDFLKQENIRDLIYGGYYNQIQKKSSQL